MKNKYMKILSLVLVIIILVQSCTPARMALTGNDWNNPQGLAVKGKNGIFIKQKLSFGEYKTVSVKRSWTKGDSRFVGWTSGRPGYDDYTRIIGTEFDNKHQTMRFEMINGKGDESSVFCVSKFSSTNFTIGKNPNSLVNIIQDIWGKGDASSSTYWAAIYIKSQSMTWELMLDNQAAMRSPNSYTGLLAQSRDRYYTIVPVNKLMNKKGEPVAIPFGSVGFEIRNKENKALAAVNMMDKGIVYLNDASEEEKFLMANACAAILLQQQLE
jgi:hypothetical protein